jgi:ABC-type Co2+ transport system permease subunit
MALEHIAIFGIMEGLVTAMILKYFMKNESELVSTVKEV